MARPLAKHLFCARQSQPTSGGRAFFKVGIGRPKATARGSVGIRAARGPNAGKACDTRAAWALREKSEQLDMICDSLPTSNLVATYCLTPLGNKSVLLPVGLGFYT